MDELKLDYRTKNLELIKAALPGIYVLLLDDEIVFVGESQDIKKDITKHLKKGMKFSEVGIIFPNGNNKQQKQRVQSLIDSFQPPYNKSGKKNQKQDKQSRTRRGLRAFTQQKKTPPKSEPEEKSISSPDQPAKQKLDSAPRPVQSAKNTAEQIARLLAHDLGISGEVAQQAVERLYYELSNKQEPAKEITADSAPAEKVTDTQNTISDEARQALIAWTQKVTQKELAELPREELHSEPTERTNGNEAETVDLPNWLVNLADETPSPPSFHSQESQEQQQEQRIEAPTPSIQTSTPPDDQLPAWTRDEIPVQKEPVQNGSARVEPVLPPVKQQDLELPEWMKDIDMSKASNNSTPPFA